MDRASISSAAGGRHLFDAVAGLAYAYCLGVGVMATSDCLSEEKREGTLGLLFLTDLKGYDVILGKLAASSMHALYGIFAVFPLLAIPLLLGGLTSGEFWRMLMVLTNTLFLSLTAGLAISSMSRSAWRAKAGTIALLFVTTAGVPLFGSAYASIRNRPYDHAFSVPSATYAFEVASDKAYRGAKDEFQNSMIFTSSCTIAFLILGSIAAPRSWQERPPGARLSQFLANWKAWSLGAPSERKSFRRRLLDENAFFWLAARERLKPATVWSVLGLGGVWWCWLCLKYPESMFETATYIATGLVLHTIIKVWIACEAGRLICEDRRTGALELILSTPLTIHDILDGQLLALKRQFGWASGIILVADFCMILAGLRHHYNEVDSNWFLSALAAMTMFVMDLFALAWVGMWLGLTTKKPTRVAVGAMGRILVLPWGIFFLFLTLGSLAELQSRFMEGDLLLAIWFCIGACVDLVFFVWARSNLYQHFRTMATQRFDQPQSLWSNLTTAFGSFHRPPPVNEPVITPPGNSPRPIE